MAIGLEITGRIEGSQHVALILFLPLNEILTHGVLLIGRFLMRLVGQTWVVGLVYSVV